MSDILIRGMEMPTVGVPLYIEPDGTVRVYQEHGMHVTYHAVSIPPHGRLGDLDALIDDLKYDVELDNRALDYFDCSIDNRKNYEFDIDVKRNAISFINDSQTIIPASK